MTIKQLGGVFGRNPTFNDVTIEGTLTFDGDIDIDSDLTISGDLYLPDNSKAIFGTGSDLQIYHDGSNSYIEDVNATTDLIIRSYNRLQLKDKAADEMFINCKSNDAVELYHDGALKFSTTATGIDVTGTVTADGLTVDGLTAINSTTPDIRMFETDTTDLNTQLRSGVGKFEIKTLNDAVTLATKRFEIDHTTGDISFYDDAAAQGLFWDSSASALGIGTTTPAGLLNLHSASGDSNFFITTGNTAASTNIFFGDTDNSSVGRIVYDHSGNYMNFRTNGSDAMRITSAGDVGIGTASPASALDVAAASGADSVLSLTSTGVQRHQIIQKGTGDGSLTFYNQTAAQERMRIDSSGNVGIGTESPIAASNYANLTLNGDAGGQVHFADNDVKVATISSSVNDLYVQSGAQTIFRNGGFASGDEAMRIDSSGNLLVGTTSSSIASANTTGAVIVPNGASQFSRDGGHALDINRVQDGEIVRFRSAGNAVGSISTISSDLCIGSSTTRVRFDDNGAITPRNGSDANSDATIDLGQSGGRFKDLYLSGGVVFGATGGAVTSKTLDDYEEGTWTPALGGTWTTNPTALSGIYTKVGNVVTIRMKMTGGVKSSAVSGYITGLPFATNNSYGSVGSVSNTGVADYGNCLFQNTDRIWLTETNFGVAGVWISGVYETTV